MSNIDMSKHSAFQPGICGYPKSDERHIICTLKPKHHGDHYNVAYNTRWLQTQYQRDMERKTYAP